MNESRHVYLRLGLILLLFTSAAGCSQVRKNSISDRAQSSNHRDWTPSLAKTPRATIINDLATIRNVRQCSYLSEDDYTVDYSERKYDLSQLNGVDFIVVPFGEESLLAHTMLSFGFEDGEHVCVSAEVRTEKGEEYSPVLGALRQFEITYVVGDERDLILLRTKHRDADVYVYPTTASREQAKSLFIDVMRRVNKLNLEPEFYNTITNNCTTNIASHVNELRPNRIPYDLPVLFPGLSDRYAYRLGLLDQRLPFDELKRVAKVNRLANAYADAENFSVAIRRETRVAMEAGDSKIR